MQPVDLGPISRRLDRAPAQTLRVEHGRIWTGDPDNPTRVAVLTGSGPHVFPRAELLVHAPADLAPLLAEVRERRDADARK